MCVVFAKALTVGSIRGIAVRVDLSWILIAALVTWSFWSRFGILQGHDGRAALVMAILGAGLFFGSILAHELAHALEARHRGVEVGGITLFLFGGVSETKSDVERPRDEFALTAVGPYTSFVLAAAFGLGATLARGAGLDSVADVAGLLGWLNLALGVFNLLPGAPLDGGRILRAIVWRITGDRRKAIVAATTSGRILGGLILGVGLLQVFFVRGGFVGGLWFVFIGWFLMQAALMEQAQAGVEGLLEGVPVHSVLPEDPHPVPAAASAEEAAEAFLRHEADHLPVRDDRDMVGVVALERIKDVPRDARSRTPVADVMVPVQSLPSIDVDDDLSLALERLDHPDRLLVAKRDDRVVGLLTAHNVMAAAQRMKQLAGPKRTSPNGDRR